jgi:hypothetical protein
VAEAKKPPEEQSKEPVDSVVSIRGQTPYAKILNVTPPTEVAAPQGATPIPKIPIDPDPPDLPPKEQDQTASQRYGSMAAIAKIKKPDEEPEKKGLTPLPKVPQPKKPPKQS